ncbi:hypothetical protein MHK_010683 [Candidatus Magnetomorum sp. HK-1]|nr:hypothetical protein MHK_010683 [Candidatus Magnetomorum sp. HK-1]
MDINNNDLNNENSLPEEETASYIDNQEISTNDEDQVQQNENIADVENKVFNESYNELKEGKTRFVITNYLLDENITYENDSLFVESNSFSDLYNGLINNNFIFLLGKFKSGKKTHALKLATKLQKNHNIDQIYMVESISENNFFDMDYLLSIKNAVVILPDISGSNFTIGQHFKIHYPNKNDAQKNLIPVLKNNNCWIILTLELISTKKTLFYSWIEYEMKNSVNIDLIPPDLLKVFHKRAEYHLMQQWDRKDHHLMQQWDRKDQIPKRIHNLTETLLSDYISFGKEVRKCIHLDSASDVAEFFDKSFQSLWKGFFNDNKEWKEEDFREILQDKVYYKYFSIEEETKIKLWFDNLEPEEKCAVVAVTLFDNCTWPIFWYLYEKIREILFPTPPLSESESEGNLNKKYYYQLKPIHSFIAKNSDNVQYNDKVWLKKIRSRIIENTKTGAHIVSFIQPELCQEMLTHLIEYHRYELSKIAIALGNEATKGHYTARMAIARAIGKIGELDFSTLVAPVIRKWLKDDKDRRKQTIIHLFTAILRDSSNQNYKKNALNYILKEISKGKKFPHQWIAIKLCAEIGMWDENYLDESLNLLKKIIMLRWSVSVGKESLNKTITKIKMDDVFISTIMYTLRNLTFHHTPIPILKHIFKWISDPNDKVKLFAAHIAFTDKKLGIPWLYFNNTTSAQTDYEKITSKSFDDTTLIYFLHTVCVRKEYRNQIVDIITQILKFIENNYSDKFMKDAFNNVLQLIHGWLVEAQYHQKIYKEILIIIKGIIYSLREDMPAGKTFKNTLKKWQNEGIYIMD